MNLLSTTARSTRTPVGACWATSRPIWLAAVRVEHNSCITARETLKRQKWHRSWSATTLRLLSHQPSHPYVVIIWWFQSFPTNTLVKSANHPRWCCKWENDWNNQQYMYGICIYIYIYIYVHSKLYLRWFALFISTIKASWPLPQSLIIWWQQIIIFIHLPIDW